MMDEFNLAICFGPTLLPVPEDRDLVFCQTYVNELIKNIIVHYETVFPFDGGVVYERFVVPGEGCVSVVIEVVINIVFEIKFNWLQDNLMLGQIVCASDCPFEFCTF